MSGERWARCAGFSAYEVSTSGRVRQRFGHRMISAWANDQGYLYVNMQRAGVWKKPRVHRLVWLTFRGAIEKGKNVDHRNSNRGDPRLKNLRTLTQQQQNANQRPLRGANIYKGVTEHVARRRFQAQIKKDGVNHFLGRFTSDVEAARAYDRAARRMFGRYAALNF